MKTFSIDPVDEGMHEPTDDPQFNESMYFNFVEPKTGFGTLVRMGNRVNEGHAEVTVLVYLPGGGAAIRFDRAPISGNLAFDAAGLRFQVVEPLACARVTFAGEAHRLARGTDLAEPKRAFATSPVVPVTLDLDYRTIALHGMGGSEDASGGLTGGHDAIATGHYQGPCRVTGRVTVGEETFEVDGGGFRDHSWGPRRWQAPRWWRWVSCLAGSENGFVGWLTRTGDAIAPGTGMVLRDGEVSLVRGVSMASTYGEDAPHYPESMALTLETDRGALRATGQVVGIVPLRHRREGTVARIAETICEYAFDGHTGYGFAEYHDLMVDGLPAGRSEA